MLIDSHAHLELDDFDDDRDDVIRRARVAGVESVVTVGINLEDSRRAVAVAKNYSGVFASVGVHPHDAESIAGSVYDDLRRLADEPEVVAYGEIGLDFFRNRSPRAVQIRCFGEQLDLAAELGLPVIIHDRDAHRDVLQMLSARKGAVAGVVHCFSGDYETACRCIDLGYLISFPGTVTFSKAADTREVVRRIPLEHLIVETDAPFLAPVPMRGKRNEPAFVVHTARKIAEIKGCSFEEIASATTANARRLFRIPEENQLD